MKYLFSLVATVGSLFLQAQSNTEETSSDKIRIVCKSSIEKSDQPLYVINGKVSKSGKLKKLKPKNIKHIQVIKGDSARAIYGSAGANGVIVITTKSFSRRNRNKED